MLDVLVINSICKDERNSGNHITLRKRKCLLSKQEVTIKNKRNKPFITMTDRLFVFM